jgi:hypothetical protein
LTSDEKQELAKLLEFHTLSHFEKRERRFRAAQIRLCGGVDKNGDPRMMEELAVAIAKARNGRPLTRDEYIVTHFGFLPGEIESMKGAGEWCA